MTTAADHVTLARELNIPHGHAVTLARSFCPSGDGSGPHGDLSPCDECTLYAVKALAALRDQDAQPTKRGRYELVGKRVRYLWKDGPGPWVGRWDGRLLPAEPGVQQEAEPLFRRVDR